MSLRVLKCNNEPNMKWKQDTWTYPIGVTIRTVEERTLKGILGICKSHPTGWSLIWLRENQRIMTLPRMRDCKALGEEILPLFDNDGQLQDASLRTLKGLVNRKHKEGRKQQGDGVEALDFWTEVKEADIPKVTSNNLPDQSGQQLPVSIEQLARYAMLHGQYVGGKEVGLHRYRFVRSHYSTVEVVIDVVNYGAAAVYEALDVILWCVNGFDPDVTREQLIEWIEQV